MKAALKKILPHTWLLRLQGMKRWRWFRGNYVSWAEARAHSEGYDSAAVLDRILAATRKVQAGLASWERDGWTFELPEINRPLVAALKAVANERGGVLDVVDFGGSLGSTWWQHRSVLAEMGEVRWRVVEQGHFVEAGHEFAGHLLTFHRTLDDAQRMGGTSVILLSSVLPYLEKPHELLGEVGRRGFSHVILDRTPFIVTGDERLVVQRTPPGLGGGSYPCWLFERSKLIASLGSNFELKAEWPGTDAIDRRVEFKGMHFQRIVPAVPV